MISFASKGHLVVFALVAICFISAVSGLTCFDNKNKCLEDECCVQLTHLTGICKKLRVEGEKCSPLSVRHILLKHVYVALCPCSNGLKCVEQEGLIGKINGNCQVEKKEEKK